MKKYFVIAVASVSIYLAHSAIKAYEFLDKAQLGRRLFFDPVLSKNRTISCASCHKPSFAFADTSKLSMGVGERRGTRNTPTVMNTVLRRPLFWDGRALTLEEQALMPIENKLEMDLPIEEAIQRLKDNPLYREVFFKVFNAPSSGQNLSEALAAFERTLETTESAFDKWQFTGDTSVISESARRGFIIFNKKGNCVSCHFGSDFTRNEFRNIGLFNGKSLNDSGRSAITGNREDLGKFKTPTLRNIEVTAPYMHNGMFKTLAQVIEFYNDPDKIVRRSINRDSLLKKPLGLTSQEKKDLEAFLRSLTDKQFVKSNKMKGD